MDPEGLTSRLVRTFSTRPHPCSVAVSRLAALTFLPIFLACLLLPAEAAAEAWWVVLHQDGSQQRYAEELPADALGSTAEALWLGSSDEPPRRVLVEGFLRGQEFDGVARTLDLRVEGLADEDPEASGRLLEVIAAPVAMWLEVSEDLLPRIPLGAEGRGSVVRAAGEPWRVRLVGTEVGSWWVDVAERDGEARLFARPARDFLLAAVGEEDTPLEVVQVRVAERPAAASPVRELALYRSESGRLTLPALPDRDARWTVTSPGRVVATETGRLSDLEGRWVLREGRSLTGRLVDSRGEPLPDMTVVAGAWIGDSTSQLMRRTRSDEAGRFRLAHLEAGSVVLVASGPGRAPSRREVDLRDESLDLGSWTLEEAGSLEVRVLDPEGRPVAGAEIKGPLVRSVVTNDDGVAVVEGLSPSRATELVVEARHYLPGRRPVRSGDPSLDVILRPGFVVSGTFVDGLGHPLPHSSLRKEQGNRTEDLDLAPDGTFELTLTPDRSHSLFFQSPSTRTTRVDVQGAAGEWRDLGEVQGEAGRGVVGRLIAAHDGAPVAGAHITAPRSHGPRAVIERLRGQVLRTQSEEDGSFRLSGLGPEETTVRIEAVGLARRDVRIAPSESAPPGAQDPSDDLDLGVLELVVGAQVRVVTEPSMRSEEEAAWLARIDLGNRWLESDMLTARVDDDGQATFDHVPAGPATVSVVAGRRLLCDAQLDVEPAGSHEVVCSSSRGRVSGQVTVGGVATGRGTLHWRPPNPETPGLILHHDLASGERRSEAFGVGRPQVDVAVDPSGYFSGASVGSGSWSVAFSSVEGWSTPDLEVQVPEGDDLALSLDFPALVLSGRVVDESGEPVGSARVRESTTGMVTRSQNDGGFRFVGLAPGARYVNATQDGLRSSTVERWLDDESAPEPVILVLRADEPETVLVRVTDADSLPVPGALVLVEEETRSTRILTCDRSGETRLRLAPPHPPALRLAAFGNGRWHLGSWQDPRALLESSVELVIGESGSLRVEADEWSGLLELWGETGPAAGWNVGMLLARVGRTPYLSQGEPWTTTGLPAGTYRIGAATTQRVSVEAGEETVVDLDP